MLNKIDEFIIARATAAYMWLLDWTGVYVGSVGFTLMVLDVGWHEIVIGRSKWYWVVMLTIGLIWGGYKWRLQHAAKNEKFNAEAKEWTEGFSRGLMVRVMLVIAVVYVATGQWQWAVGWLPFVCWVYLNCVLIRDREKKQLEFGRKLATATMGGRR